MGSSVYTLTFDTAWAYPDKAMLTISAMYPNLSFVLCSVEEQPAFRAIHVYEKGDSHGVTDQLLDIFDAPNWDKDEERAEEYWEIVGQEVRRTVLPAGRFREWELTVEKIHSMALKGRAWNNALAQ